MKLKLQEIMATLFICTMLYLAAVTGALRGIEGAI